MTRVQKKTKVTVPELARQWGVSPKKITGFIRSGELRAVNLATRNSDRPRYAIDVADVEAFERSREVVPDGGESTTKRLRRRAAAEVKQFV